MLSHEKKLIISPQSIKPGNLYAEMQDCHAVNHVNTSMMDASRLADSRRAEYGDEDMANSVRAVGTSSPDTGVAASAVLVLARKSAGIAMLQSLSARHHFARGRVHCPQTVSMAQQFLFAASYGLSKHSSMNGKES